MPASPILSIAKKDLRLVWRDRRALVVLLAMPLAMICVLGLSLGEGFGQKADDRLRISVVDLDEGFAELQHNGTNVEHHWSKVVEQDLAQTAGIRVELIASRAEAEGLVRDGRRAAVLVFGPTFSRHVTNASFMTGGVNPFDRDGVRLKVARPGFARRSHSIDRRVDHRSGSAGHGDAGRHALDDRPGIRKGG